MKIMRLLLLLLMADGVPGLSDTTPFDIAPDGAWTWFNDERSIFLEDGSLLTGYVRSDGKVAVSRTDLGNRTSSEMVLSEPPALQKDDHNNPSLTLLADGRVLAMYSMHNSQRQFYHRTSRVAIPRSPTDWGPQMTVATPAGNTYNNTFRLPVENSRLYLFHRCIGFNPNLSLSEDGGKTWSPPREFIHSGDSHTRPYCRFTSDGEKRIDLIYTDGHPRNEDNSLYHLYLEGGKVCRTDGSLIQEISKLPLQHNQGEVGSLIYAFRPDASGDTGLPGADMPGGRAWNWDLAYGADGRPVCVFQTQRDQVTGPAWSDDRIMYGYSRWDGDRWQTRFIAHGGRGLYEKEDDYGGGMALDPQDPGIVYLSSNALKPFDLNQEDRIPLHPQGRYELYRGVTRDGGASFRWVAVTTNSTVDQLRPIVPEHRHGRPAVLLWFAGTYEAYTRYQTRIRGAVMAGEEP